MSKATHTPGPWTVSEDQAPNMGACIDAVNGVLIAEASGDNEENQAANARIISAAPDLLAALESLTHPRADDSDIDMAREAIAKARGQ